MAKRGAANQLTSDNWERDSNEKEDGGIFQRAPENELKNRPIKKAKRSMLRSNESTSASAQGGLFAGIKLHITSTPAASSTVNSGFLLSQAGSSTNADSLFGKTTLFPSTSQSGLSFGNAGPVIKIVNSSGIGNNVTQSTGIASVDSIAGSTVTGKTDSNVKSTGLIVRSTGMGITGMGSGPPTEDKFLRELRLLNTSVSKWINQHLEENPYVDLSPVFNDYFEHLRKISKENGDAATSNSHCQVNRHVPNLPVVTAPMATIPTVTAPMATTPITTVPLTTVQTATASASNSLTDVAAVKPAHLDEPSSQEDNEDDDVLKHPSGEENGHSPREKEESGKKEPSAPSPDSLMSVRCKLFYKKEGSFADLGVGQLSVEERPSGVRLLLRNDTSLGKVLLNVHLKGEVPVTQQKNNLLIVCPANPPLTEDTSKAVTYLIRVKDVGLAQELHGIIKKHL